MRNAASIIHDAAKQLTKVAGADLRRENKLLKKQLAKIQVVARKLLALSAVDDKSSKVRIDNVPDVGALRERLGLTPAQLAALLRVSLPSIYKWQSGDVGNLRPRTAEALAKAKNWTAEQAKAMLHDPKQSSNQDLVMREREQRLRESRAKKASANT